MRWLAKERRWTVLYSGSDSDRYFALQRWLHSCNIRYRARYFDRYSSKLNRRALFENHIYYDINQDEDYMHDFAAYDPSNGYLIEIRSRDAGQVKELLKEQEVQH